MPKDDLIRLQHMIDSAKETLSFARNKNKKDLYADRMLALSIVKSIEIIGEAASTVSKKFRERHKAIPWTNIVAMRNRLIHVYFDIDLDRVWDTITDDLPPLIIILEKTISEEHKK
jgi:uncharacterized protein with HEPN domain